MAEECRINVNTLRIASSNASGNRLISFLNEVELVVCNGRSLVVELGLL